MSLECIQRFFSLLPCITNAGSSTAPTEPRTQTPNGTTVLANKTDQVVSHAFVYLMDDLFPQEVRTKIVGEIGRDRFTLSRLFRTCKKADQLLRKSLSDDQKSYLCSHVIKQHLFLH